MRLFSHVMVKYHSAPSQMAMLQGPVASMSGTRCAKLVKPARCPDHTHTHSCSPPRQHMDCGDPTFCQTSIIETDAVAGYGPMQGG